MKRQWLTGIFPTDRRRLPTRKMRSPGTAGTATGVTSNDRDFADAKVKDIPEWPGLQDLRLDAADPFISEHKADIAALGSGMADAVSENGLLADAIAGRPHWYDAEIIKTVVENYRDLGVPTIALLTAAFVAVAAFRFRLRDLAAKRSGMTR